MKLRKKVLAVFLCALLAVTPCSVAAAAIDDTGYRITNPYADVDWQNWEQYKANLHTHTDVSDGDDTLRKMVQLHYDLDYDFLAITDHSTVCYSWTDVQYVPAVRAAMSLRTGANLIYDPVGLTEDEYKEVTTPGNDGKTMLQVPFGIEQNGGSFNNTHVNSWFVDYGNGVLGATSDYETALSNVEKLGGLSVINHPGEYTNARDEDDPEKAYDESYSYYINKFANLLEKYPSCLGIDINSKGDGRTRNDRKLWDLLLQKVIPTGRTVTVIATSDAHRESAVDSGWTVHPLPEQSIDALRTSMETGAFFAASHYIKNAKELAILGKEIGEDLGTEWTADFSLPDPTVTEINVNDAEDTISIQADHARTIHWIADGEVIAVGDTIDLDAYANKIGSYVRAEIFGDGGILYTQAFTLDYDGAPEEDTDHDSFFDFGTIFRKLYDILMIFINGNNVLRELHEWLFT